MIYLKFPFNYIYVLTFLLLISYNLSAKINFPSNQKRISSSIHFERLTTLNGLSNNTVYDVIQDRMGFIWFATDDGLNRFDGYEFEIFRSDQNNENSLTDNSIWTIMEDGCGNIWCGTKNGGLNCYNPVTGKFRKWKIRSDLTEENTITVIYEDRKKFIWIGTYRSGLYKLDQVTGKISHWESRRGDYSTISSNYVSSIVEDSEGSIWISTYDGLNKFIAANQKAKDKFIRFYHEPGNPETIGNNVVWYLSKSKIEPDIIWIGTADGITKCITAENKFSNIKISNPDGIQFGTSAGSVIEEYINNERILWIDSFAGLLRFNITSGEMERFISIKDDPYSLASNHIYRMFKDKSGVLWVATENGISCFSPKSIKFNSVLSGPGKFKFSSPGELNMKSIKAIIKTEDGIMWIGTEDGLFYTEQRNGNLHIKKHPQSEGLNIWSLSAGSSNDLWIGTYGAGMFMLDLNTNRMDNVYLFKENRYQAVNYNKVVYADNQGNIWIGFWGFGLCRYNPSTGEYKLWQNDPKNTNSLSHNDVWAIHQDKKGRIWICTNGGGLNLFTDIEGGKFIRWTAEEFNNPSVKDKKGYLSSNSIYSISESQSSEGVVLWIGTNNGLNKFVIKNSGNNIYNLSTQADISYFTVNNGLADNSIKTIQEDNDGKLWLGTSSGISSFDIEKSLFTNYSTSDGIIGQDFNFSSAFKDENGMIFMGSAAGLNYFDPKDIIHSAYDPPILITDFQIFNRSVPAGENSPLKKSILYTEEIVLPYTQNVFSFRITALDYNSPSSIQYAYIMEGFDKDWIYSGNRRFITYTNLKPGDYVFKIKSTNSDGVWNENGRVLKVIITPPWWQTGWAIGLYALIFIAGLWGIIKFQSNRTKLQAELKMREFESNHLRAIESMKSRFFANLSHEFRTPLMLIKGPLEQLMNGRIKGNVDDYYKMLFRNTENLQNLIDQLLELSQLDAETVPLKTEKLDLVNLLSVFTNTFIPLAAEKNIQFGFKTAQDHAAAFVDPDKLQKIINNLLSNAFKFTPEGGGISVELITQEQNGKNTALVKISDTGIGIPDEHLPKIFDRFFQIDDSSERNYGGFGIGLALVKELVSLHKWDISVKSREGGGTVFTLKIPIDQETAIIEDKTSDSNIMEYKKQSLGSSIDINTKNNLHESLTEHTVLVVEDSSDVRKYLYDLLSDSYKVLLSENGEEGIVLALKTLPELIISDVMMPGMDGIELCKKIKSNWETSHIPVILLTAKASQESKIEGLETGADDYITKPFSFEELSVRIKNLINQRKLLHEKFSKEINVQPCNIATNSLDKEFLERILNVIEENLHNEEFDTEVLAKSIFVSRSQLNRKLQAITGQGPGEFIRIYKLKRAAQKIMENRLSITQIAYEVGFGSPAQFTRAFQKHFNCLPSEFLETANQRKG